MSGDPTERSNVTGITVEVDRSRCVLCGGPNDCAMASKSGASDGVSAAEEADAPCWCVGQTFPQDLTKRASEIDEGASCICRHCLEQSA